MCLYLYIFIFFFFNDTATTEIYTLSLHDALPISTWTAARIFTLSAWCCSSVLRAARQTLEQRSEEHTSELQSQFHLVCRLLLEKKKKNKQYNTTVKNYTSDTCTYI